MNRTIEHVGQLADVAAAIAVSSVAIDAAESGHERRLLRRHVRSCHHFIATTATILNLNSRIDIAAESKKSSVRDQVCRLRSRLAVATERWSDAGARLDRANIALLEHAAKKSARQSVNRSSKRERRRDKRKNKRERRHGN